MSPTEPLAYLHGRFYPASRPSYLCTTPVSSGRDRDRSAPHFPPPSLSPARPPGRFRQSLRGPRPPAATRRRTDGHCRASAGAYAAFLGPGHEPRPGAVRHARTGRPLRRPAGGAGQGPPTLGLHTFPLPFDRYARLFREGATLLGPSVRQPAGRLRRSAHQAGSRLHWWLAEQEVHESHPSAMPCCSTRTAM